VSNGIVDDIIANFAAEVATRISATRKTKAKFGTNAENVMKAAQKGTMKWIPFMSSFILDKM
jgi:nucleoside-diphosphate-sugar epimerase